MSITVRLEFTPNPNTLKYSVNVELLKRGTENFESKAEAINRSEFASMFFDVDGVEAVMIGSNFVTVSIDEDADIEIINDQVVKLIEEYLKSGKPIFVGEVIERTVDLTSMNESEQETVKKIIDILDREIRPAVAMDGGDIEFDSYKDGKLFLTLSGACSGCPSSRVTLKDGVEARLKQVIPELHEVVAVNEDVY